MCRRAARRRTRTPRAACAWRSSCVSWPSWRLLDEQAARPFLRRLRFAGVAAPIDQAPHGALRQLPGPRELGDGLGVKPAARQHRDAVVRLVRRTLQQFPTPGALEEA